MARKSKYPTPRAQVDPTVLKRVTDEMLSIDSQKGDLASERSQYSTEAKENAIEPKAHGFLLALLKMPPAKRHLTLDCFDAYRAALKLDAWQSAEDPQSDIEDAARAAA